MLGIEVTEEETWQLSRLWQDNYETFIQTSGLYRTSTPNIIMVRPEKTSDDYVFYIRYYKQNYTSIAEAKSYSELEDKYSYNLELILEQFDEKFASSEQAFNDKFLRVFGDNYKTVLDTMPDALMFGKETLAQLFGGMGYFYGPIRILNESDPSGKLWYYDEPGGLFTCTPSRPYFPRGFLWDEGFHS